MKHKYKKFTTSFIACIIQIPTVFAQFNTIHEFGDSKSNDNFRITEKIGYQLDKNKNQVDSQTINENKRSYGKIDFTKILTLPLKNIFVTSSYGERIHPITKKRTFHNGLDLRAFYENVYTILPGIVFKVGEDKRSGKFVIIATGEYKISYCHLSKILVSPGNIICSGTPIAISGSSGMSTGPHLHLTLRLSGILQDPTLLLQKVYLLSDWRNK